MHLVLTSAELTNLLSTGLYKKNLDIQGRVVYSPESETFTVQVGFRGEHQKQEEDGMRVDACHDYLNPPGVEDCDEVETSFDAIFDPENEEGDLQRDMDDLRDIFTGEIRELVDDINKGTAVLATKQDITYTSEIAPVVNTVADFKAYALLKKEEQRKKNTLPEDPEARRELLHNRKPVGLPEKAHKIAVREREEIDREVEEFCANPEPAPLDNAPLIV